MIAGCTWPLEGETGFCDQSINTDLSDLSNMNSIQCDSCLTLDETSCESNEDCYWKISNTIEPSVCKNKCSARMTMGECEQYTMWNQSSDDGREFSFDGQDHKCMWYPDHDSIDNTYNSKEVTCSPIIDNYPM